MTRLTQLPTTHRLAVTLPVLLLAQLGLVAAGSWPQLSARTTGEEIQLRVRPVDPIDPFRGAYVALNYPDLRVNGARGRDGGLGSMEDGENGTVYVTLRDDGDVWVAEDWTRERPDDGTYLRCDDRYWQIRCGIESWFLPQDEALALEKAVQRGTVVATVKVDGRGNAAIVGVSQD
ncbi:GDYXXLXY domain-containing protein [Nocardioides sp. HDW12B]|uniref:GDYXXLXY domain-containing protein n=1 Tax=Nocardioides sp. HDW12B TaxID=2714939 RepID=UPI0014092EFB|nr:GDYXXLXY domain-containing protein [Nocardioides sp. HDW12B]QIK66294.1 GDYXXLXY domain-containing protein [Nocardioides sp. HDW12B]